MIAKEYLQQYRTAYREAKDTEIRMAQLRLKYSAPSAIEYSDMPHAHNTEHDLSDYAANMDELTNHLISKYAKCMGIEVDILKRLDRMEHEDEREILRMRYIDGRKWQDIADRLHYSFRNVTRVHGRALQHFPMDDVL